MNFCLECDEYISLFIDDLLDEIQKEEFLQHINQCSKCAQKFKEASLLAELCKESDEIQLTTDFSSSLHKRLVNLNAQENKNKGKLFVFNKKWIASLSTAAILVISLLAYNLLPQVGFKSNEARTADENLVSQSESAIESNTDEKSMEQADLYTADSAQDTLAFGAEFNDKAEGISPEISDESSIETKVQDRGKADSDSRLTDTQLTMKKEQLAADGERNTKSAAQQPADQQVLSGIYEADENEEAASIIASLEGKYYSNYAELGLKVTTQRIEIDVLKNLLIDLGAVAIPVDKNKGLNGTTEEFINYYLPMIKYYELVNKAVNDYNLKLSIKTDIFQKDITNEYNEMNTLKVVLDIKIEEAKARGEDTSVLEIKQKELSQKINDILVKKDLISVRIFIYR